MSSVTPNITGKGIIKRALRLIGAKQSNEQPTATELQDGLESLNSMLDSWNTEKLVLYAILRSTFSLIAAKENYTIGSGLDFDVLKPGAFQDLGIIANGRTSEVRLRRFTDDEYAAIVDKTVTGTPTGVWFDGDQTFHFYPVPTAADTFCLYAQVQLVQISDMNATFTLPAGFKRALDYNLAIELAPEWGKSGGDLAAVVPIAIASKSKLKALHNKPLSMKCDVAITPRLGLAYSIYTNELK